MPAVIDARRLSPEKQARLKVLTAQVREHLAPHVQAEALRFVTRFAPKLDVEPALLRFLQDCNMPTRLSAETYDRVLVLCADITPPKPEDAGFDLVTLVRPDRWWRRLREAMDETQLLEFWIRLAIAEAHERLLPIHAGWAREFAKVCMPELPLEDALSAYSRDLELNEPLLSSVYQRTLALFAADFLPQGDDARIRHLLSHLHPVGAAQAPGFGLSPVDLPADRMPASVAAAVRESAAAALLDDPRPRMVLSAGARDDSAAPTGAPPAASTSPSTPSAQPTAPDAQSDTSPSAPPAPKRTRQWFPLSAPRK